MQIKYYLNSRGPTEAPDEKSRNREKERDSNMIYFNFSGDKREPKSVKKTKE